MGAGDRERRSKKKKLNFSPSGSVEYTDYTSTLNSKMSSNNSSDDLLIDTTHVNCDEEVDKLISGLPDTSEGKMAKQILMSIRSILVTEISKFTSTITELKNENHELREKLKRYEPSKLNDRLNKQYDRIVETEKELYRLNQYGRRNNVEFAGITEEVKDGDLENKVVELLKEIDVPVTANDIEACHRIGKKSDNATRRTIVRFVNRKNCVKIMKNKSMLKNVDKKKLNLGNEFIYANYSLCREYRKLWYNSKKLFYADLIDSFWVTNGTVRLKVESEDPPSLIEHQSDLAMLFPKFNFNAPIVNRED